MSARSDMTWIQFSEADWTKPPCMRMLEGLAL